MERLRFKDENGNEFPQWQLTANKKILKERKEYSEKLNGYPHLSLTKEGVVDKSERYERDFLVRTSNKKYKITRIGDLCYNPANLKFGVITLNENKDGIFSPIYITFQIKDGISRLFAKYFYLRNDYINKVLKFEEGTVYERKAVKPKDFLSHNIKLPTIKEQEKIGGFLSAFDRLIEKQREKIELLKISKKGYIQNVFNQNLRFKDDNGKVYTEWKSIKIGDILEERDEKHPISSSYPLMAFTAQNGVSFKGDRYNRDFLVKDTAKKKYKRTELNDFIYSSNNLETGSIGSNKYGKASISPVYSIFKTKGNANPEFVDIYMTRRNFIGSILRYRQGVMYGQWRIKEKHFLNHNIVVPVKQEQEKIGRFLSGIDNLIQKEEKNIEKHESMKKGYLQRLFYSG